MSRLGAIVPDVAPPSVDRPLRDVFCLAAEALLRGDCEVEEFDARRYDLWHVDTLDADAHGCFLELSLGAKAAPAGSISAERLRRIATWCAFLRTDKALVLNEVETIAPASRRIAGVVMLMFEFALLVYILVAPSVVVGALRLLAAGLALGLLGLLLRRCFIDPNESSWPFPNDEAWREYERLAPPVQIAPHPPSAAQRLRRFLTLIAMVFVVLPVLVFLPVMIPYGMVKERTVRRRSSLLVNGVCVAAEPVDERVRWIDRRSSPGGAPEDCLG